MNDAASISITVCFAAIAIAGIIALMVLITIRRDVQPLKIKSPRLMLLSMFGNLIIIFSVCIIQVTEEKCINIQTVHKSQLCEANILLAISLSLGYMMIGFTEPLAIIAYVLRAFRLRRIFDAQLCYFKTERKPTELIENFKEIRLIKILVVTVGIFSVLYLSSALALMYIPED